MGLELILRSFPGISKPSSASVLDRVILQIGGLCSFRNPSNTVQELNEHGNAGRKQPFLRKVLQNQEGSPFPESSPPDKA